MRSTWMIVTVILVLIGFAFPALWVLAIISGIVAIASSPGGVRVDGQPRTGGLLGGLWDAWLMHEKMRECPRCKGQIQKDATKCKHCGSEVRPLVRRDSLESFQEWGE